MLIKSIRMPFASLGSAIIFSIISSSAVAETGALKVDTPSEIINVGKATKLDFIQLAQATETAAEEAKRKREERRAERERKRAERAAKRKKRSSRPRFGSFN